MINTALLGFCGTIPNLALLWSELRSLQIHVEVLTSSTSGCEYIWR